MRFQVIAALQSLSDPKHQQARWGRYVEGVNYYDDLTLNLHVLYDDCMVLPEPREAVPDVLRLEEVAAFEDLERALGPVIRELGERPDDAYVNDSRWPSVVDAAARALAVMEHLDREGETL